MSLSNNHLNDFGDKPVNLTRDILSSVGIQSFGYNYNLYDTPQVYIVFWNVTKNIFIYEQN